MLIRFPHAVTPALPIRTDVDRRASARKVNGSANWKKPKARVHRIHARIANARADLLHKASNTIGKDHAMITVEDLQIRNMVKSASGTVATPGCNVRAKSRLNKAILDQGWYEFRRHISADSRKTQALFACVNCGHEANAGPVGAINVLHRGDAQLSGEGLELARIACGESVQSGHSMKQEPTQVACDG
ncbi:RNA-guided endonuclease InsQ/TnpB family protein [Paraburkholderia silviterrae]|uniref:Transposase n=1 Tax=Paraburkholderia silviterrae TaxID=2528715 RepID=A0A4V2ZY88_9BURK|nr:transposase [Paraburkholderia silviterrae]